MAKTRTISFNDLTENDKRMLDICSKITDLLSKSIPVQSKADAFMKIHGRVHYSRDAGMGVAAGKLQRDALTTRGKTDKSPFSNRNLRWHPLVLAYSTPPYAIEVDNIDITGHKIVFIINGTQYYPEDLFKLENVFCAPFRKWSHLAYRLSEWSTDEWSENRCTIPALEYSTAEFSVGTFATLGIAVAYKLYGATSKIYQTIIDLLRREGISNKVIEDIPPLENLIKCPLCLADIDQPPGGLQRKKRPEVWQPTWRSSKRSEGAEEVLQITHIFPLIESEIRHRPSMVRYGHRWCNVAMTDHSVDETVDFMKAVVSAHEREEE